MDELKSIIALQKHQQKLLLQLQKDQYEQQKKQKELQLQQHMGLIGAPILTRGTTTNVFRIVS